MVSNTAKKLDEALDVWRECPLGKIDYLMVDARYEQALLTLFKLKNLLFMCAN